MTAFFGPGYAPGGTALAVLVVGFVTDSATGCNTTLLSMLGHSGLVLMNGLAGGVVTVCLCLLLVPSLGITGAAAAVTVARSLVNVMATTEIWRLQRMHPFSAATARIMAAGILAALLGLLSRWQLGLGGAVMSLSLPIALVTASYFALLRMTRVSWRMT